ncbi:MAG: M13 family peptidase, partial [Chitinophagaceae bacterium]
YMYSGGTWIRNNPVPAKETRWGAFNQLRDFNINAVKDILEKLSSPGYKPKNAVERRVADFYNAAMDSVAVEKLGYSPIKSTLARINTINNVGGVLNEISRLRVEGMGNALFGFGVGQDRKDVSNMIPQFSQGGTTLPDRDYYLKDDKRSTQIQEAYKKYLLTLFSLVGNDAAIASAKAAVVFNLEKQLAEAQMGRVEMRDPYKTYNKFHTKDFNSLTPGIDWNQVLTALQVKKEDTILVNNPSFFTKMNALLKSAPLADWKTYLEWNVLKAAAPYLSSPFVDANFAYNQVMTGQRVQTPRWQRISAQTDASIPDLLGQLYVKEYFKPEAKARMEVLVSNLRKAFANRIKELDWMSAATKEKALAKLAAFRS